MKMTVDFEMFAESFVRVDRRENFSYCGLKALFEYLEELEDGLGEEIELDPIGFCCEFAEYGTEAEIKDAYGMGIEELREETLVLEFDGGFIVLEF